MKKLIEIENKIKYEGLNNIFSTFAFYGQKLNVSDENIYYTYINNRNEFYTYIGKINLIYYIFVKFYFRPNGKIFSDCCEFLIVKDLNFYSNYCSEIKSYNVFTNRYNKLNNKDFGLFLYKDKNYFINNINLKDLITSTDLEMLINGHKKN